MSFKIEVKQAAAPTPIPEGLYLAKFTGLDGGEGLYGPWVKLEFEIVEGKHAGTKRSVVASAKLTGGKKPSKLYTLTKSMLGKEPEGTVDYEQLIGNTYNVLVETDQKSDGEWQNVTKIMKTQTQKAAEKTETVDTDDIPF